MLIHPVKSLLGLIYNKWPNLRGRNPVMHWLNKPGSLISAHIHGRKMIIPSGFLYPEIIRRYPTFNNPLLEISLQLIRLRKRISIIDIGASVGDTIFFLNAYLPKDCFQITGIEGNEFYYRLLIKNTNHIAEVKTIQAVLSDKDEPVPELQISNSSASATGKLKTNAFKLDTLAGENHFPPADLIKIDTDGYDGNILRGATNFIHQYHPAILFEFHPLFIQRTGNNPVMAFETLSDAGYSSLLWYDKFGEFAFETGTGDLDRIRKISEDALLADEQTDVHYDILALWSTDEMNNEELQNCTLARKARQI